MRQRTTVSRITRRAHQVKKNPLPAPVALLKLTTDTADPESIHRLSQIKCRKHPQISPIKQMEREFFA